MAEYGFQQKERMMRVLAGAAGAASIAGLSGMFEDVKINVRQAAPVGGVKRTVHFATRNQFGTPIASIGGGRTRKGGRTKSTVNFAYPRIDARVGFSGAFIDMEAQMVMAPQGIYQDRARERMRVSATNRKTLGWMQSADRGIFVLSVNGSVGSTNNTRWLRRAMRIPVNGSARAHRSWVSQFTGGGLPRVKRAFVVVGGFRDTSGASAWFGELYPSSDAALRKTWQQASARSRLVFDNQVNAAINRL